MVIIGGFLFCIEIYFTIVRGRPLKVSSEIEVMFRSSLASVFGFILSSNTKNNERRKKGNGLQRSEIKKDEKYEYCERRRDYDYGDGITSVSSAIVILMIYTKNVNIDISILSQLRDLMCTSIGFLLGESKIRND